MKHSFLMTAMASVMLAGGVGGHIVVLRHNASWFRNGYKKPPMAN